MTIPPRDRPTKSTYFISSQLSPTLPGPDTYTILTNSSLLASTNADRGIPAFLRKHGIR